MVLVCSKYCGGRRSGRGGESSKNPSRTLTARPRPSFCCGGGGGKGGEGRGGGEAHGFDRINSLLRQRLPRVLDEVGGEVVDDALQDFVELELGRGLRVEAGGGGGRAAGGAGGGGAGAGPAGGGAGGGGRG